MLDVRLTLKGDIKVGSGSGVCVYVLCVYDRVCVRPCR